jgi:hypothetical protein
LAAPVAQPMAVLVLLPAVRVVLPAVAPVVPPVELADVQPVAVVTSQPAALADVELQAQQVVQLVVPVAPPALRRLAAAFGA